MSSELCSNRTGLLLFISLIIVAIVVARLKKKWLHSAIRTPFKFVAYGLSRDILGQPGFDSQWVFHTNSLCTCITVFGCVSGLEFVHVGVNVCGINPCGCSPEEMGYLGKHSNCSRPVFNFLCKCILTEFFQQLCITSL